VEVNGGVVLCAEEGLRPGFRRCAEAVGGMVGMMKVRFSVASTEIQGANRFAIDQFTENLVIIRGTN
jgi:hypothetical protein